MTRYYAPRSSVLIASVLAMCLMAPAAHVPAASVAVTPVTPDPALCTVISRPADEFATVVAASPVWPINDLGTPAATPSPPDEGVPADDHVQEVITETVIIYVACVNASDLSRIAALMTDDFFHLFFAGITTENITALETAPPLPREQWATVEAVTDIHILPDGRVSARVLGKGTDTLLIFRKLGDRYLVDYIYNLPGDGTSVP